MQSPPTRPVQYGSESRIVPRRKSPPPPFINLDDCKPIISTTTTNTSRNSSNNGTTAFVFTSSRTLRALRDQEESGNRLSPTSPIPSPATPPTPSSVSSQGGRHRAQLTLSQLTKHSEGAIDARSLIGPKMRAAGFVNLPRTQGSRSDLGSPGTPASPSLMFPVSGFFPPTPNDPPNFPPIVFVDRSAVTAVPLWEYQREVQSLSSTSCNDRGNGKSSARTMSKEPTPGPSQAEAPSPAYAATHPPHRTRMQEPSGSSSPEALSPGTSGLLSSSDSSSTLVSPEPFPFAEPYPEDGHKGEVWTEAKTVAKAAEPSEYPFPPTYDSHSPQLGRSPGSRASSATASPTVYAGLGPAVQPLSQTAASAGSSLSCRRQAPLTSQRRVSGERRDGVQVKQKPTVEPTPTFATAKRPQCQRQYSLTELCDSSPYVWLTKMDVFPPPTPISRSPIPTPSLAPPLYPMRIARPPATVEVPPPPHRRHHTAPDTVPTLAAGRHHRIASAPLRGLTTSSVADSPEQNNEKAGADRATKAHDRAGSQGSPRATTGGAEGHRSGDGALSAMHGSGPRARGRTTQEKTLSASETAQERAAAAEADLELEKAKEGLAAMVLAHRERDREYARHVAAERERDKLVKQKQRAHHKLRGKLLREDDPSESEMTMVDQQLSAVKPLA